MFPSRGNRTITRRHGRATIVRPTRELVTGACRRGSGDAVRGDSPVRIVYRDRGAVWYGLARPIYRPARVRSETNREATFREVRRNRAGARRHGRATVVRPRAKLVTGRRSCSRRDAVDHHRVTARRDSEAVWDGLRTTVYGSAGSRRKVHIKRIRLPHRVKDRVVFRRLIDPVDAVRLESRTGAGIRAICGRRFRVTPAEERIIRAGRASVSQSDTRRGGRRVLGRRHIRDRIRRVRVIGDDISDRVRDRRDHESVRVGIRRRRIVRAKT